MLFLEKSGCELNIFGGISSPPDLFFTVCKSNDNFYTDVNHVVIVEMDSELFLFSDI